MGAEPPRRAVARPWPLSTWLLVVVAPLAVAALFALAWLGDHLGRAAAIRAATAHLTAVRAAGQAAVEAELQRLESRLAMLAAAPDTASALGAFATATHVSEADPRLEPPRLAAYHAALRAHLERWYAPRGTAPLPEALPALPPGRRALWLQAQYVAGHAPDTDGPYAAAHGAWHPRLSALAREAGVADLLLVRASDGLVLYDVAKLPVFQTSLLDGPFADSRLGTLFRHVRLAPGQGTVTFADAAPFAPARGAPLVFAAVPVFAAGDMLGVLVAALDPQRLAPLLTAGGRWEALGLGERGEIVLVGSDGALRTPGRLAAERGIGSPAPLPTEVLGSGEIVVDHLDPAGRLRRASVGPAGFGELGWRTIASIDHADAGGARAPLFLTALALGAGVIGALALVAWWLLLPLRHLGTTLARLRPGERELRVPVLGHGEVAALATQINRVLDQQREAAAGARRARTQEVRALATALAAWRPGEASPSVLAVNELTPLAGALDTLAERLGATPAVAPAAVDALRAAAMRLCRDAESALETLETAGEAARRSRARRDDAADSAAGLLARTRALTAAARAAHVAVADVARPASDAPLAAVREALAQGVSATAQLADELSVLAVNVALTTAGTGTTAFGDEARLGVERIEQMGSALEAALAEARRLPDGAAREGTAAAERQLATLVETLAAVQDGLAALDGTLHGAEPEVACAQAVASARDTTRRVRQTAELVANEAAAVTAGTA